MAQKRKYTTHSARAIRRLYELKGIDRSGGRPAENPDTVSGLSEVAQETNMHPKKVQRLRTLADLIPELAQMLEGKKISQKELPDLKSHYSLSSCIRPAL